MKSYIAIIFGVLIGLELLGGIHFLEPGHAGEELEFYVNVNNPTSRTFEEVSLRAYFLELGDLDVKSSFDLDSYETNGFKMSMPIPSSLSPGEYWVKIVASSEEVYDSQYVSYIVN